MESIALMDNRRTREKSNDRIDTDSIKTYYNNVYCDFKQLKKKYPFCYLTISPTNEPSNAIIKAIAINKSLIDLTKATENDFKNSYSRELWIVVPWKYRENGCDIYGGKWINPEQIPKEQQHFYNPNPKMGYKLCVGVPESFVRMENVILENVKTADHILTAYADYMSGREKTIILNAYSHGDSGINEYRKKKYKKE